MEPHHGPVRRRNYDIPCHVLVDASLRFLGWATNGRATCVMCCRCFRLAPVRVTGSLQGEHHEAHGHDRGIHQGTFQGSHPPRYAGMRWQPSERGEHDQARSRVRAQGCRKKGTYFCDNVKTALSHLGIELQNLLREDGLFTGCLMP